jgi:oligopeptide/dipeptide ABC transporter ATP-binding protein
MTTPLPTLASTETPQAPVAVLKGVAISIRGISIVSRVDLEVSPGESVGLVGESGSGKSVTCRALMGLLGLINGEVTGGTILIEGVDMAGARERQWSSVRGRVVSLVPQASLAGLDPVMKVGRQLAEVVRRHDPGADTRERCLELLDLVQMPKPEQVLASYPHQLPGGMRQRAMIAAGIAGRPRLLVADEPTTALDASVQQAILRMLQRLREELGMALVLVSHDLSAIRKATDSVAVMYAGSLVESGPTNALLAAPRHPYSSALIGSDPALVDRGRSLRSLYGDPPQPGAWPEGCRFHPRCRHTVDACRVGPQPPITVEQDSRTVACLRSGELSL